MGYGVEVFRQSQVWIVPVRVVVYGIRYRIDIHVSVLALTSKSSVTLTACVTCFPFPFLAYLPSLTVHCCALQDYGGSPTLFGVASVINHISEIFAYFFSFKLIRQMGHVKVRGSFKFVEFFRQRRVLHKSLFFVFPPA